MLFDNKSTLRKINRIEFEFTERQTRLATVKRQSDFIRDSFSNSIFFSPTITDTARFNTVVRAEIIRGITDVFSQREYAAARGNPNIGRQLIQPRLNKLDDFQRFCLIDVFLFLVMTSANLLFKVFRQRVFDVVNTLFKRNAGCFLDLQFFKIALLFVQTIGNIRAAQSNSHLSGKGCRSNELSDGFAAILQFACFGYGRFDGCQFFGVRRRILCRLRILGNCR